MSTNMGETDITYRTGIIVSVPLEYVTTYGHSATLHNTSKRWMRSPRVHKDLDYRTVAAVYKGLLPLVTTRNSAEGEEDPTASDSSADERTSSNYTLVRSCVASSLSEWVERCALNCRCSSDQVHERKNDHVGCVNHLRGGVEHFIVHLSLPKHLRDHLTRIVYVTRKLNVGEIPAAGDAEAAGPAVRRHWLPGEQAVRYKDLWQCMDDSEGTGTIGQYVTYERKSVHHVVVQEYTGEVWRRRRRCLANTGPADVPRAPSLVGRTRFAKLASRPTLDFKRNCHDVYWQDEAKLRMDIPRWRAPMYNYLPLEMYDYISSVVYDSDSTQKDFEELVRCRLHMTKLARWFHIKNTDTAYDVCLGHVSCHYHCVPEKEDCDGCDVVNGTRFHPLNASAGYHVLVDDCSPSSMGSFLTFKRSVVYDHCMHLVVGAQDTLWCGNVRFKPKLTRYASMSSWRETPLARMNVAPGLYRMAATDVVCRLVIVRAVSDKCRPLECSDQQQPPFEEDCAVCRTLWAEVRSREMAVENDRTPHFHLSPMTEQYAVCMGYRTGEFHFQTRSRRGGLSSVTGERREEVFAPHVFDRYVHVWASTENEMTNGTAGHFNWWDGLDNRHGATWIRELKWPVPQEPWRLPDSDTPPSHATLPDVKRKTKVDFRTERYKCATKMLVKNPETFFNRNLYCVQVASGGRKGALYSLVDLETNEVCGALAVDSRGDTKTVHDCQEKVRDAALGVHLEPYAYTQVIDRYSVLLDHLKRSHGVKIAPASSERVKSSTRPSPASCKRIEKFALPLGQLNHRTPIAVKVARLKIDELQAKKDAPASGQPVNHESHGTKDVRSFFELHVKTVCTPYNTRWYEKSYGSPMELVSTAS